MAIPQLVALGGLGLAVIGAATASDAVSLRELAHAIDMPLLSGAVVLAREAMPNSVAHTLEPLAAMAGLAVGGASCWRAFRHALRRLSATQPLNQLAT